MKRNILILLVLLAVVSVYAAGMPKNIGTVVEISSGVYPADGTITARGYMIDRPAEILTESSYGSHYNSTYGIVGMNVGNFETPWEEDDLMDADFFYNGVYAGTMTVQIQGAGSPVYNTANPFPLNTTSPRIYVNPYGYSSEYGQVETGSSSEIHTFVIKGYDLTSSDVVISAPAGYEFSLDNFTTFSNTLNITPSAGEIAETVVYVRFRPSTIGESSGYINLTTSSAATRYVKVNGEGLQGSTVSYVKAKAFLQGAYTSSQSMNLTLNANNYLPLTSPYADAATVAAMPADVVDWISVELRATVDGVTVQQKSMLIKDDGSIVGIEYATDNTVDYMKFDSATPGDYYIVLRHRNHMDIMSASIVSFTGSAATANMIDFSIAAANSYTTGPVAVVEVETGVWAIYCGDINGDGYLVSSDNTQWVNAFSSGVSDGYHTEDLNFDASVLSSDNSLWASLFSAGVADSQVPSNTPSSINTQVFSSSTQKDVIKRTSTVKKVMKLSK